MRLDDLPVEQVSGAQPGASAEPADVWRTWLGDAADALAAGTDLPAWPSAGDPGYVESVAGIHVCAPVDEGADWLEATDPGPVEVAQCVLERVSGTALQVVADLRDIELRGLLVWTAARAGHVEGERVLLAQTTVHRVGSGLASGPCSLTAADSLVTGVANGPGFVLGPETELVAAPTVLATGGLPPFEPEPAPAAVRRPRPGRRTRRAARRRRGARRGARPARGRGAARTGRARARRRRRRAGVGGALAPDDGRALRAARPRPAVRPTSCRPRPRRAPSSTTAHGTPGACSR